MNRLIDDNVPEVFRTLLNELGIKYTNATIDKLKREPYFPYIDSIGHSLSDLGINNVIFKTSYEKLKETVPAPFIVHLNDYDGLLLVVKAVTEDRVVFAVGNEQYQTQSKEEFIKRWSGYVLMVNTESLDKIKEENYEINFLKKTLAKVRVPTIAVLALGILYSHLFQLPINIFGILITVGVLSGIVFNILIIILEIDQNNPLVNNICSSIRNKKINCSGILSSKGASFYGLISWSQVGIIYFLSLLGMLLIFETSMVSLTIISIFSILAFTYTFYSIYYQWKVVKKWCKLCLFVQTVLIYLFIISVLFLTHLDSIIVDINMLFYFICILSAIMVGTSYILPLIKKLHMGNSKAQVLETFKYDPRVFSMYWKNERILSYDSLEGSAISYGEENSKKNISIIINPTCNHCITAHNALLKILKRFDDIHVQEVFFVPLDESNISYKIALKMVDIYLLKSKSYFLRAIGDYYKIYSDVPKKWIKKYWDEDLRNPKSEKILNEHRAWCEDQKLIITPLVTFNNFLLPKGYTVQDLKYFL